MAQAKAIANKLSSLVVNSVVIFPNSIERFRVVENEQRDVVMFQSVTDSSKTFHLFYDEIDPIKDNFIQLS